MTVDSNGTTAKFLPTPSVRRATLFVKWRNVPDRFLPTPSARRATDVAYRHPLHADISTHALREEGDLQRRSVRRPLRRFLPTPSARRATNQILSPLVYVVISTHALREEGDRSPICSRASVSNFYPRPPRGWRRSAGCKKPAPCRDFYPRPPRGGRPDRDCGTSGGNPISTHALREEGDRQAGWHHQHRPISTHALREEGDGRGISGSSTRTDFYPRPPRGGRRRSAGCRWCGRNNFYPRPPRGGRPRPYSGSAKIIAISTHALREEGDTARAAQKLQQTVFLPTPSARRATQKRWLHILKLPKFLPTPFARRATIVFIAFSYCAADFYPRPPRGGRHFGLESIQQPRNFYPRPPRGGRRAKRCAMSWAKRFLPTPSARRATTWATLTVFNRSIFLPTPSARRATELCGGGRHLVAISTHALREEGDLYVDDLLIEAELFLPTPSARRATQTSPAALP